MTKISFLDFHFSENEILTLEDRIKDSGVDITKFTEILKDSVKGMQNCLLWNDWNFVVRATAFGLADNLFIDKENENR